jgi:hypothetical protein
VNHGEAEAVVAIVRLLVVQGRFNPKAVAVLSSYNAQVEEGTKECGRMNNAVDNAINMT